MLQFKMQRGPHWSFRTTFEVLENTLIVSRFAKSKLWLVELPHDGTIGEVSKICNNLAKLDDDLFIDFVKIKTMDADLLLDDDL